MKDQFSFIRTLISKLTPFTPEPAVVLAGITRGVDQLPIRLFSSDDREKVEVTRRRRGEGSGAGGRERAEAPIRRREDEGAPSAPRSMGGTEDMSGGGIPVSMIASLIKLFLSLPLPIMAIVLLLLCCVMAVVGYFFFQSPALPEDMGGAAPISAPPTSEPLSGWTEPATTTPRPAVGEPGTLPATETPRAPSAPSASSGGNKWLVMLYQDATDQVLDQDIYLDLNEAERTGST